MNHDIGKSPRITDSDNASPFKRWLIGLARRTRGAGLALALLLVALVFALSSPAFLTYSNFLNIAIQSALNIVTATGMTFVIASAGIDLSTGSVLALTGIFMAMATRSEIPAGLAILLGLLGGAAIGALNGWIIGKARITPFIATLAMSSVARALALILTDARPIYGLPMGIRVFGTGTVGPVPYPAILALAVIGIGYLLLVHTPFGRKTLAIGGSEEAARLSGIGLVKQKVLIYLLAGTTYAIGALIVTARLNTAEPIAGSGAELDAIAAAVIGGAELSGGVASIPGTLIGALILAVLRNGLTLLSVQPYYQQLTIGIVIVVAVLLDQIRKR